jgi:hypothetical protein
MFGLQTTKKTSSISFIFTSDLLLSVLKKVSSTEFRKKKSWRPVVAAQSFLTGIFVAHGMDNGLL